MKFHRAVRGVAGFVAATLGVVAIADDKPGDPIGLAETYGLTARQYHPFPGAENDGPDVMFGIIPTRGLGARTYYNPVRGVTEQVIQPPVNHPVPVLRARHVRLYDAKPDLTKIARDDVKAFENQATLTAATKYALVGDDERTVALLTLSDLTITPDKPEEWRVSVRAERVAMVNHIADPARDRGRAVVAEGELPLAGHLTYGVVGDGPGPMTLMTVDLGAKPRAATVVRKATECRAALEGTVVDKVNPNTLEVSDKAGRHVGTIKLEDGEIGEFNVSADGARVVVDTERFSKPKGEGDVPHRETASLVFTAAGHFVREFVGYDDGAFLPSGNLVLTGAGSAAGLFVGDAQSGKVTPIDVQGLAEGEAAPRWPRNPAVSPDGKRVAYLTQRDAFVVDIDGRGLAPVWSNPDHDPQARPVFSPDGKYVAFINVPVKVMSGPGEVYVFDVEKHVRAAIGETRGANSKVALTWQP